MEGAVVHLVDLETKGMRSFITKKDGTFLFEGLNKDTDYELFAEFNDLESRKRRLSSLDPADKLVRNTTLEPKTKDEKKESASPAKKKS